MARYRLFFNSEIVSNKKNMKVRKVVMTLLCFAIFSGMESCSDSKPNYVITENRNVSACGIVDPLYHVDWLTEFCKKHTPADFTSITVTISIYVNKTTRENHYVVSYSSSEVVEYSSQEIYDCSGTKLFFKAINDPTPAGWSEFFAANEIVATIWELKKN